MPFTVVTGAGNGFLGGGLLVFRLLDAAKNLHISPQPCPVQMRLGFTFEPHWRDREHPQLPLAPGSTFLPPMDYDLSASLHPRLSRLKTEDLCYASRLMIRGRRLTRLNDTELR